MARVVSADAPATSSKGRLDDAGQQVATVSRLPKGRSEARKAGIAAEKTEVRGIVRVATSQGGWKGELKGTRPRLAPLPSAIGRFPPFFYGPGSTETPTPLPHPEKERTGL